MLSACLLLLPFISCTQVQDTKNDAVIEQKIEALLSRMTLEEKIGQMNQISSYGNIEDMSGLIKKEVELQYMILWKSNKGQNEKKS